MTGMLQALEKSGLIVAWTGHPRNGNLVAKGQATVTPAVPELPIHIIATGIPIKMRPGQVKTDEGPFARRRIRSKYRLQEPYTGKSGCIRERGCHGSRTGRFTGIRGRGRLAG